MGDYIERTYNENRTLNRRLPSNTELLDFGRRRLGVDTEKGVWNLIARGKQKLIGFIFGYDRSNSRR